MDITSFQVLKRKKVNKSIFSFSITEKKRLHVEEIAVFGVGDKYGTSTRCLTTAGKVEH